jgi:hypothetical protein
MALAGSARCVVVWCRSSGSRHTWSPGAHRATQTAEQMTTWCSEASLTAAVYAILVGFGLNDTASSCACIAAACSAAINIDIIGWHVKVVAPAGSAAVWWAQ